MYPIIQTQPMKNLSTAVLMLLFIALNSIAFAQKSESTSKEIFAKFPGKINISENTLSNTLNACSGENVSISFNNEFIFTGTVVSNEKVYENLQTIIIKSPLFDNAVFQLSKVTLPDQTISFVGRIINTEAADAYVIARGDANDYQLEKIKLDSILQDCSL